MLVFASYERARLDMKKQNKEIRKWYDFDEDDDDDDDDDDDNNFPDDVLIK